MTKVGFVGTGVMGLPMARNVIKGGYELSAFDINPEALQDDPPGWRVCCKLGERSG